jgi:hypothetical protein
MWEGLKANKNFISIFLCLYLHSLPHIKLEIEERSKSGRYYLRGVVEW